jgi:hypothetical protein
VYFFDEFQESDFNIININILLVSKFNTAMNRVYQNTFVNLILKFTQNRFFKAIKGLKRVFQERFSFAGNFPMNSSLKWIWVILLLFSFEISYSQALPQLNNNNISCTGCSVTNSYGYATAAIAVPAAPLPTTYNLNPGVTLKQCATVKTDANGSVGIMNQILTQQPSGNTICTTNTAFTRKGSLYAISGGSCSGPEIPAFRKGTNSGSFNNEYVGLLPNTNYAFVFTTTVDGSCTQYQTSVVKYYGFTPPAATFAYSCGTGTFTGTFSANGVTGQTGTLTVPITGTTPGLAIFNVTSVASGITGTLTTGLVAGQTSVVIPVTYTGSGTPGSRTLTTSSSQGTGTCTKVITVAGCTAGTTAPVLSSTSKSNVCPATTANLSSLVSSTCPLGSNLEWHNTNTGLSAANKILAPTMVAAGTYYPVCFDATTVCYSPTPATGVSVTISVCPATPALLPTVTQTGAISTVKTGNASTDLVPSGGAGAYTYTNGNGDPLCVAPVGASPLPVASNLTINLLTGAYSYTRPPSVGTYYFCVKVCDSTSPTPFCNVAVYKVIVTAPPCNAGTVPPGVN